MTNSKDRSDEAAIEGVLERQLLRLVDHIDMRFESLRHDLLTLNRESTRELVLIQNDKLAEFDQRLTEIEKQISGDAA